MCNSTTDTVASVVTAFGTLAVSALAIWGSAIKNWVAGPQLEVSLRDRRGDLNTTAAGARTVYHHLIVRNRRAWSPAEKVRVLVVGVSKRGPTGKYAAEPVIAPLQLTWAFPTFHELFPTIADTPETCDLGFLEEGTGRFILSTYISPNNFRGYITKGSAMQVNIIASAHNAKFPKPLRLEISWDGQWSNDLNEMLEHLLVREVNSKQD